ncbi:hypothetical protein ACA910_003499 [Epithemia clementina (nom. ined.)]
MVTTTTSSTGVGTSVVAAAAAAVPVAALPLKSLAAVSQLDTTIMVERLGKAVVAIALGYVLARLKRSLLEQWTNRPMTSASDDDGGGDVPHHLYFYNLLGNGMIGSIVFIVVLKLFRWQHGAGAGLQSLFAAGGLGAVVFGIASRNVAEQVVGGLVIAATNAYDEGDRIRLPESNIEGTVKRISLIDTDIEGYDYSVIQIPNSRILNQHVINLSRVKRSRVQQIIRLRYSDLPKVPDLVQRIPDTIAAQATPVVVTQDVTRPIRAHLSNLKDDHVEMIITCHLHCRPGSAAFLHWRQQVLLAIAQAVRDAGADFSLPTSILEPPPTFLTTTASAATVGAIHGNNNNNNDNGMEELTFSNFTTLTGGVGGGGSSNFTIAE